MSPRPLICLILTAFVVMSCAPVSIQPPPARSERPAVKIPADDQKSPAAQKPPVYPAERQAPGKAEQPDPRALAALELTRQAEQLLSAGRYDDAIRMLERALALHPSDGRSYYYLAEAWALKGNIDQALEFNRLAGLYLKPDVKWRDKVDTQRRRLLSP